MSSISTNPYRPGPYDNPALAPFVGREKAFDYIYQQLNAAHMATTVILGWRGSGKTALLSHFDDHFGEAFIGVFLPLARAPLANEATWLRHLARCITAALTERDYSLSRVPEVETAGEDVRGWMEDQYLPEALNAMRRHRRVVLLMDDAEHLLNAVQTGALPADTFSLLQRWTGNELGAVLTLDARREDRIPLMSPLVSLTGVFRLENLTVEDSHWLMWEPVKGLYMMTDDGLQAIYRATGGQPLWLQRFGFLLYRRWESEPDETTLTLEDMKSATKQVYEQSEDDFKAIWDEATRNERLLLTAMVSLLYADPLATITPDALSAWLTETEYPLDLTTIHAAVRGLEYREVIAGGENGLTISAGLMQTWLLENARLTPTRRTMEVAALPGGRGALPRALVAVLVAVVVVVVLLLIVTSGSGQPATPDAAPTVTLVNR
jgi:hypothetical protein